MSVTELTKEQIEFVAGGYPVCTVQGSGYFTPAGGSTLYYSSQTVNSNGSTTLNLTGGGTYVTPPITDPYLRGLYINQMCMRSND
jgi:hypothetical protein